MDNLIKIELRYCPTFKVSLNEQWHRIVDRLNQVVAVYVPDENVFAYCHWWNSLTKRKQGVCASDINARSVETLLANYSFNDRIIHYFHIKVINGTHHKIKHDQYKRVNGSTCMTLVPGPQNGLFPSRKVIQTHGMFEDVGLDQYKNIYIEWPMFRLEKGRNQRLADLVKIDDNFDISAMKDTLPEDKISMIEDNNQPSLFKIDQLPSGFKSCHSCLKVNGIYNITGYGYKEFRGKEYLHIKVENDMKIRCSPLMRTCIEPKIEKGKNFKFKVVKIAQSKGSTQTECIVL